MGHTIRLDLASPAAWDLTIDSNYLGSVGAVTFTIQEIAGHASVMTSQRYVHPVPETIQLAVTQLELYRKAEAAAQRPSLAVVPKTERPATVSATLDTTKAVAVGK